VIGSGENSTRYLVAGLGAGRVFVSIPTLDCVDATGRKFDGPTKPGYRLAIPAREWQFQGKAGFSSGTQG
jgi:hypothetical protein